MTEETGDRGDDDHLRCVERMPALVRGELSSEELATVNAHLQACAECRALLDAARELREGLSGDAGRLPEHPEARLIDEYARRPESLDESTGAWVGAHLRACKACAEAAALAGSGGLGDRDRSRGGLRGMISRTVLHPLAAAFYLAALLALVPFALREGASPPPSAGTSIAESARIAPPAVRVFSAERFRGQGAEAASETPVREIPRPAPGATVRIELVTDLDVTPWPEAGLRLRVAPAQGGEPVIDTQLSREAVSPTGVVALEIPEPALNVGRVYRIDIRPRDASPLFVARFAVAQRSAPETTQPDQ